MPNRYSRSTACTIIARNYLAQARVFARSYREHHPDHHIVALILDDDSRAIGSDEPFDVVRPSDIMSIRAFGDMATMYSIVELATAVKPFLLRRLLDDGASRVAYFDPDIEVFAPLDAILGHADEHGVVLTPHLLFPPPTGDGLTPNEDVVLSVGTFNLGFIVVGEEAPLRWWADRLSRECVIDPQHGRFVDQRWADLLAGYSNARIERDPGLNVAWWNLATRRVRQNKGDFLVDGVPLKFFHYSGYDPRSPWLLTKHQGGAPRVLLSEEPALKALTSRYGMLLKEAGYETLSRVEYGLDVSSGGMPIGPRARAIFREALIASDRGEGSIPPNAFSSPPRAFVEFLAESDPMASGPHPAGRFIHSIWQERDDLRQRFPDVHGDDASAFAAWAKGEAVRQGLVPPELARAIDSPRVPRRFDGVVPGVHVIGPLAGDSPNGEIGRRIARGLSRHLPVQVTPITRAPEDRRGSQHAWGRLGSGGASGVAFSTNVFCLPHARALEAVHLVGPPAREGSRNVGLVAATLDLPASLDGWSEGFDELWAFSRHAVATLSALTPLPVRLAPIPAAPCPSQLDARRSLGLDRAEFLVSIIEDFTTPLEKMNALASAEAFLDGLGDDASSALVVYAINANSNREAVERVRHLLDGHPRAQVVTIGYNSLPAAVGAADCLVSLTTANDLALPMIDAMEAGIPVVGSASGAHIDALDGRTGWLCGMREDGDPIGGAAALNAARHETAERELRALQAREHADAHYSVAALIRFLSDIEPQDAAPPRAARPVTR